MSASYGFSGGLLFDNLSFVLTAGARVGLVGPNGSGKTTLMRLLRDEIAPLTGEIQRAPSLRIDQNRPLNPDVTLRGSAVCRWRFRPLPGPPHSRCLLGGALPFL
ncbi:MAG: ATP-binding cassette domain-containing protein [Bryobacteraceae bacterium]